MKSRYSFIALAALVLSACNPSLNVPPVDINNQKLNSLLTLEVGENTIFTEDFIADVSQIDSVTVVGQGVEVSFYNNRRKLRVDLTEDCEPLIDIQLWIRGNAYSIPCRKSDKVSYVFRYDPQGTTPGRVQIAGQMNDWTPSATPDLVMNDQGMYEVTLLLSPGTYLYQMLIDGDQNHDTGNQEMVDNGYGKFNSILQIPGNHDRVAGVDNP